MQASLLKAALKLESASKEPRNLHNETGKDQRNGDEDQIEQGKGKKAVTASWHNRHQRNDPITRRPDRIDRKRKKGYRKSVEWKDPSHWKLAAAKTCIRVEEITDPEREREGAKAEWDPDKGAKEIDPASHCRKRAKETASAAIRIRHEGIPPQEEHKAPSKMIAYDFYQITSPLPHPI